MMKHFFCLLLGLLFLTLQSVGSQAATGAEEMKRLAAEVAALELGFGEYILGATLTSAQKTLAKQNTIPKTLEGTIKFNDGDIYVVAKSDDGMILGIYKEYGEATREDIKELVGELMMQFEEPTTMAHDKLIYWAFDKNGKIGEDEFDLSKQTGETDLIATVKFQSSQPIKPDAPPAQEEKKGEQPVKEKTSVYVIISSNPLSRIFLAEAGGISKSQ